MKRLVYGKVPVLFERANHALQEMLFVSGANLNPFVLWPFKATFFEGQKLTIAAPATFDLYMRIISANLRPKLL